jgi:hypothetical protein
MTVLNRMDLHVRGGSDMTAPSKPNSGVSSQNGADCDSKPARLALTVVARHCDTIGDHD